MSESKPPKPPMGPKGAPGEQPPGSGGTNWRVLILFGCALAILMIAWYTSTNANTAQLDFAEFRKSYERGQVLEPMALPEVQELSSREEKIKKLGELGLKETDRLTFVTQEGAPSGRLVGKRNIVDPRDLEKEPKLVPFRVAIDTSLHSAELDQMLSSRDVPLVNVAELSSHNDSKNYSIKQLREWLAKDEVVLDGENVLKIYKKAGTSDAVLEGTRREYPMKGGEAAEPVWQAFSVSVNTFQLSDRDKNLINSAAFLKPESNTMRMVLLNFLPIILIVLVLFFLFRHQMKNAGKGAMNFGKSKARLLSQDKHRVTFKDVAGIQEAKEELFEIVDFLKDPKKFEKLGGNIPKGVLMVGPPGTGKTLLARAIAGEADVPFFSISGSDFVEMFVGVGASRVRDMFEQGKKNSPCIVFIDEIDAVGRHRGHGMGGGHDEREQTLNALLVEMDGFDARSGVIIIAATNRPDVLDPALLRPGRFDRQVTVALPDVKGREQILRVHSKKIKLAEGVDLGVVARGTPGFSGAELANLINEAALLAARQGKKEVKLPELEEARDKVRWGRERRSLALSDKEKENTAYHEAGHAILNILCEHTDPLHKVTIIPRGPALGMAMFLPEEDKISFRRAELIDQLCVAMGGRVAEELVFGNPTIGAMGDIRQATNIARKMVCEWGMSEELGMVEYGGDESGEVFLARDMGKVKNYSEETARKIDFEIKGLIDDAYKRAESMLTEHREALDQVAKALLEYETLDGKQAEEILKYGELKNPPSAPTPPATPNSPTVESGDKVKSASDDKEDDDPLAGDVVGAPA
ncbi:ATP-dependent zinc metalloprotease FtsH [Rubritalea squalenifaciens]|nr:ATP-dependent zinc metalloprotease FtsH [Rubritalea squalenifaciens]